MTKITKITKEQEALIPKYREEFLRIGLSTEPGDIEKAKAAIFDGYEFLGKKKPEHFFWFDSPMAAILEANFLSTDFKGNQLGNQLWDQLWDKLRAQLGVQLGNQLGGQLGAQLWDQLEKKLRAQLGVQLGNQLGNQLGGQLGAQLGNKLWDKLGGQFGKQLWAQLGVQLGNQLWDKLGNKLGNKLGVQLGDQLGDQLSNFDPYSGSFGTFEAFWISTYNFINNVLPVKKCAGADIAKRIIENTGYYLTYENAVIASDKPQEIHFDEDKRLSNFNGAAIKYRDGYGVYAIHGVRMLGQEWVCETPSDQLDAEKVMAIENVEQRLMAIKKVGIERVLSKLNSKVISTKGDEYKLHEVELMGSKEKLLEMQNPSEPKKHYEFVTPEIMNVESALAWRCGFDKFIEPVTKT